MSTALAEEPKLLAPILHTLQDLRHLPGYAGFKPQCKWRYGDTLGNDTAKYFQQRRSVPLTKSTATRAGVDWDDTVRFPTVYSNEPKLVLGARTRERDRWLSSPKYTLFNRHDRAEDINTFHTKAQKHRQHFMDKSGTIPRVDYFVLPTKKQSSLPSISQAGSSGQHYLSGHDHVSMLCPLCGRKAPRTVNFRAFISEHHHVPHRLCPPKSTWRDRQSRDVYFERR